MVPGERPCACMGLWAGTVREAGGVVSRISGAECDPFQSDLVSANPTLHRELIATLAQSGTA